MCCGFQVTADGNIVSQDGHLPRMGHKELLASFGPGGDHHPDPEEWIQAAKLAATSYYRAVEQNPKRIVTFLEIGTPCHPHILAETKPGEPLDYVDPTRACGWVRRHIYLASLRDGGMTPSELSIGSPAKTTSRYPKSRKSHLKQRYQAEQRTPA